MEVLAGARNEQHLAQLRGLMARATLIPLITEDYDRLPRSSGRAAAMAKRFAN